MFYRLDPVTMTNTPHLHDWLTALGIPSLENPLTNWATRVLEHDTHPNEWADEMLRWGRYAIICQSIIDSSRGVLPLLPAVSTVDSYSRLLGLCGALEWWFSTVQPLAITREDLVSHGVFCGLQQTDSAQQAKFVVLTRHPPEASVMPCPVLRVADAICADVWVRSSQHHLSSSSSSSLITFVSSTGGASVVCHGNQITTHGDINIGTSGLRAIFLKHRQ